MPEFFALVPAAGSGARMGGGLPKQYMSVAGMPLAAHALNALCACPEISTVFVVLAPDDGYFKTCDWSHCGSKLEPLYCGGATRAESVANGLMASELEPDDWVLVHDAARPCLTQAHLDKLIAELRDDPVGGILAVPVADTLKRASAQPPQGGRSQTFDGQGPPVLAQQRIECTEPRAGLWQAQTPQMFRAGLLAQALAGAKNVTDEASAVEALGLSPRLVESDSSNFKVTYPQDIRLAELLLKAGSL